MEHNVKYYWNIDTNVKVTYLLVILILFGGCLEGYPGLHESGNYDLSLTNVAEQPQNGYVLVHGTIELTGSLGSGAIVPDVRIIFLDETDSILSTVEVGTLSIGELAGSDRRIRENITVRLSEYPHSVLIETGPVQSETEVLIYGMNRTTEGEYEYHVIESKP